MCQVIIIMIFIIFIRPYFRRPSGKMVMNSLFFICSLLISVMDVRGFAYSGDSNMQRVAWRAPRDISMKGKGSKIPISQRGEYIKRQKILEAQQRIEASKPKGVPIFKIFVKPKVGGIWLPCGKRT